MPSPQEKYGILLAAFGASSPSGEQALMVFEQQVKEVFPTLPIRWAFTSGYMRNKLAKERVKSDSVHKALVRMYFEKYTHVAVQSLHLIGGQEYENMLEEAEQATKEYPLKVSIGKPLLHSDQDVEQSAEALIKSLPHERTPDEAVICMGHGTWHSGASRYDDLSRAIAQKSSGIFIGTLEGEHSIENLLPSVQNFAPKLAWLFPLLSLVGKHTIIDMAGEDEESWKSQVQKLGIPCVPILKGTAEYPEFVAIWLKHLQASMEELKD